MGWMSHHHLYPGYPYYYCAFYLPSQVDFLQVGEKEGWQFPPFLFFFFFAKPSVEGAIKGIAAAGPRYIMAVRGENVFVGFLGAAPVFYAIVFSGKKKEKSVWRLFCFFLSAEKPFYSTWRGNHHISQLLV